MKNSKFLEDWKNEPGSVKFWNLMILLILIISSIFSLDLLCAELIIGSIISLGFLIDKDSDGHYWILFMPLIWVLFILSMVGIGIGFSISYFNSWLDEKFNKEKDGDRN